jgi:hypothetical protein
LVEVGSGREEDWVISSEEGIRVAKALGASFDRWPREDAKPTVMRLAKVAFKHKREKDALEAKAG